MQFTLSVLGKKQIEILLSDYRDSYGGEDLRNQLYLAGINLDIPSQGIIKGFGQVYYKKSAIKYIFSLLNDKQILEYMSKFYTNVMYSTPSNESFLKELNDILSRDSLRLNEDGSISQLSMKQKNSSAQPEEELHTLNLSSFDSSKDISEQETAIDLNMKNNINGTPDSIPFDKDVPTKLKNKNEIFIVHGHDDGMKESVARLIEKFDLKPIILHEQASKGKTIMEKFQDHSENIACAIVLLSADDKGYKADEFPDSAKHRARQNVILEMGYFIGKLGREKVFVLAKHPETLEIPSDMLGVLHIPYAGDWKVSLSKEMKECGLDIDLNKI